jgi:hypothetical protein
VACAPLDMLYWILSTLTIHGPGTLRPDYNKRLHIHLDLTLVEDDAVACSTVWASYKPSVMPAFHRCSQRIVGPLDRRSS